MYYYSENEHGHENPILPQALTSTHTAGFPAGFSQVPHSHCDGQHRCLTAIAGDTYTVSPSMNFSGYGWSLEPNKYQAYSSGTSSSNAVHTPGADVQSPRDLSTQHSWTMMEHSLSSSSWSFAGTPQTNVDTYTHSEPDTSLECISGFVYIGEKPNSAVQAQGVTPVCIDGDGGQFGPSSPSNPPAGSSDLAPMSARNPFLDPRSPEPWTPYYAAARNPLRNDGSPSHQINNGPTPQIAMSTEQPHTTVAKPKVSKKRKLSRLSAAKSNAPSQRRRIRFSKKMTCWRCIVTKEKCEGGTPCKKCREIWAGNGPTVWEMLCCSFHLHEVAEELYPSTLTDRVQRNWIDRYVLDHVDMAFIDWFNEESFNVPLSVGFGVEINLVGKRLISKSLDLFNFRGLSSKDKGKSKVIGSHVLPITMKSKIPETTAKINEWLDVVFRENLGSWIKFVSRNNLYPWISPVLEAVYQYCEDSKDRNVWIRGEEPFAFDNHSEPPENTILRLAFKMAMAITVLGHCLYIADHAVQSLWERITGGDRPQGDGHRLPRVMNKMFKHCVFQSLQELTKEVLIGLDQLLRGKPSNETRRGHIFCILALLGVSVSMQQVALLDRCFLDDPRGSSSDPFVSPQVGNQIRLMEDKLHNVPTQVFHRKFKFGMWNPRRLNSEYPEQDKPTKKLVDTLLLIPGIEGKLVQFFHSEPPYVNNFWSTLPDFLTNAKEFRDMDKETAAMTNTPRLLAKLLYPLFGESTHDRRKK